MKSETETWQDRADYWQKRCVATQRALESVLAVGFAHVNRGQCRDAPFLNRKLHEAEAVSRELRKNDKSTMEVSNV